MRNCPARGPAPQSTHSRTNFGAFSSFGRVARTSADFDLGLGTAHAETDVVPAAVVGVGVEVLSAPGFAIDIELKGGAGLYRDDLRVFNASLGAGIRFY